MPSNEKNFPALKNDRLLRAAKGEEVDKIPVWVMRQAGRYLPEFQEVRAKHDFFEVCRTPELACEVTLQPLRRFEHLDASIIFSDILVIPQGLGMIVEMHPGKGPVFPEPLNTPEDLKKLNPEGAVKRLNYVGDAITLTRHKIDGKVPLIGFTGAPWTLMGYMIEGGGSKTMAKSKEWLDKYPKESYQLLKMLTDVIVDYLLMQVEAGAQLLQVFESSAEHLSKDQFINIAIPHLRDICSRVKNGLNEKSLPDVPMTLFAKGAGHSLKEQSDMGYDVIGVDWSVDPEQARKDIGDKCTLQGNLDPQDLYKEQEFKLEIPRSSFLPPEKQGTVRTILMDYYSSLVRHLGTQKQQLQALHIANQRTLHTRGELSQERKDQLEAQQTSYDRLLTGAQNFAEILGEDLGEVGEPITISSSVLNNTGGGDVVIGSVDGEVKLPANDPWQDEDTRSFYTSLPDLKVFLPNYQPPKEVNPDAEPSEEILDQELQEEEFNDAEDPANNIQEPEQEEPQTSNVSNKYALEAFLNHLPNCVNREAIDNSAVDFILNLNTKHNRKKLTRVLFSVARTRLDLLPFYARFAAILYPVLPDIGTDLSQMLKQDFKYHVRKKDQINIESKIKVVRFIGELVKFGLYSKIEALYCLKVLLHDFKHHHIEMACNLLETCGRFLYCSPDTHQRTAIYLQQMMRIKSVSINDSRHITQIENAYYYVNPPESTTITKEEEPPLHRFIKKILHQDLQKATEDKTLRLMRKVDWDNEELSELVVQWLAAGWKVKHSGRRCLARLVAALASWQEVIGSRVVDGVLEDLRIALEHPHPRHNQRRIAMARYLGELYNYKLVDSRDIFNALYSFITFGVSMEHGVESLLDPPDSAFRIRLVCVLLETCGAYFNSGSSKKKLDYFLIFFQNYYWYKNSDPIWTEENPFPIYVNNIYQECLTSLRPKLVQFTNWQECKDAIEDLKKNLYPHLNEEGNMDVEGGGQGDDEGLETIMETDDEGNSDHQLLSNSSDDEDMTETDDTPAGSVEPQDTPRVPVVQKQVEDIEFESALEKMMLDNMSERQREGRPSQRDISVPVHCRQQTKKTYEKLLQGNDNVEFVLMVRKGTKQLYKAFDAPAELTTNLKQQALANRLEMEKVKRLTLNITERQEEEDYCGDTGGGGSGGGSSGGGGGGSGNPNRGPHSRQKYQHPKGAPDVDLIFGTKKLK